MSYSESKKLGNALWPSYSVLIAFLSTFLYIQSRICCPASEEQMAKSSLVVLNNILSLTCISLLCKL